MKPYFKQDALVLYQGHALDVLRRLPDCSVQMCVTSTPYWGLRAYGTEPQVWLNGNEPCAEHQWASKERALHTGTNAGEKQVSDRGAFHNDFKVTDNTCSICGAWRGELGLEPTPELYVAHLVQIFREVKRVLREDGTLWLNLGDSYAANRTYQVPDKLTTNRDNMEGLPSRCPNGLKPKDLVGIPWMTAFALRADGWYLRQDIIWEKPNPMPESVTDRCTKSHEYIFLLAKSQQYFYDATAILEQANYDGRKDTMMKGAKKYPNGFVPSGANPNTMHVEGHERWSKTIGRTEKKMAGTGYGGDGSGLHEHSGYFDGDGNPRFHQFEDGIPARNKRSVWTVATHPFAGAHFATFPEKLITPMILAGTSQYGACAQCGSPWERMTETVPIPRNDNRTHSTEKQRQGKTPAPEPVSGENSSPIVKTVGWQPTCECLGKRVRKTVTIPPRMSAESVGEWGADSNGEYNGEGTKDYDSAKAQNPSDVKRRIIENATKERQKTIWVYESDIPLDKHPAVPCVVLDPFAGAGTSLLVAKKFGRHSIGVELNRDYCKIAKNRVETVQLEGVFD